MRDEVGCCAASVAPKSLRFLLAKSQPAVSCEHPGAEKHCHHHNNLVCEISHPPPPKKKKNDTRAGVCALALREMSPRRQVIAESNLYVWTVLMLLKSSGWKLMGRSPCLGDILEWLLAGCC